MKRPLLPLDRPRDRYLALAVACLTLAAGGYWLDRATSRADAERVPYSAIKRVLHDETVARVVLGPETIRVELPTASAAGPAEPRAYVAYRVDDPALVSALEARGIAYGAEAPEQSSSRALGWVVAPLLLLGLAPLLAAARGRSALGLSRSRARPVAAPSSASFDEVAGVDEAKEELREVVDFLRDPARFARLGARMPKGVLLTGPPGTGKTLLARAAAGEAHVPFFSLAGSEFVELFVGVGAARVRDLFARAREKAPCIVFIDEIDALGKARGAAAMSNDERENTLNQLLTEMDGFDVKTGVVVLAATNRPEILDPALLRPGRFDRQLVVDRPDLHGRLAILRVHAERVTLDPALDLRGIAAATPGFSGADLANLLNEAALLATRRRHLEVRDRDVRDAVDRVLTGAERKTRLLSTAEKQRIAFHEAGHALVGARLCAEAPVRKVSIIPRGSGALGFTMQTPLEERFLMTREELCARLAVLLAGRAAEDVVLGGVSTGAADDLRRATELASAMVRDYGMSERLGPLAFEAGGALPTRTAETIDDEIAVLVRDADRRARELLDRERASLDRLAAALLEHEVLDGGLLERLLAARSVDEAPLPLEGAA